MYKNKAKKNIITSVIFKIIILVIGLVSRRYMVNILGEEVTGFYSLFTSILGFLAVAELGIGSAIIFSMYKPISEGDTNKVSALYYLYKKIYLIIFLVITIVGLSITFFLPMLAKESTIGREIYFTYILFLLATSITYLYAYRTSFINAHMDNYVTNSIRSIFQIFELIVQIFIIKYTKSFFWFLFVHLISNILQGFATNVIFNKYYKDKINNNRVVDSELKHEVIIKTKAMFFHKIGGLLVNTIDSLIISAFISVSILGIYSNYILIINNMIGVLALVFSSIVTILGHAFAKLPKEILNKQFKKVYLVNFLMAVIFFLGFYSISNELIILLFNNDVVLNADVVIILTLNYFIQFMRQTILSFKDASGTFYNDRYKPLFEGLSNLILSLIFVKIWGLAGVLIATIITNLFITHIVEPYVLYKHGFGMSPKRYYLFNYAGIILFVVVVIGFTYIPFPKLDNNFTLLIIKGFASVGISLIVIVILYLINKTFRENVNALFKEAKSFIKKNKLSKH